MATKTDDHTPMLEPLAIDGPVGAPRATASPRLFVAVLVCCLSPLLFGFSLGFTSPVQATMEGDAKGVRHPSRAAGDLIIFSPAEFTIYAALLNVGAVPGAFAGSWAMDRLGRRNALALSAVPHVIAWGCTIVVSSPAVLQHLRLLTGFAVGMGSAVAPCYINEVAPAALRGPLGIAFQFALTLGILLVNVAGDYGPVVEEVHRHLFGNWRRLAMVGATVASVLLSMACMPESPKWLAQRGRMAEAVAALTALRSGETSAEEAALAATARAADAGRDAAVGAPRLSDYKLSLVVAVGGMVFQQLSGVNAIMMYSTAICSQAGMSDPAVAALGIMIAQVALTGVASALVELAGRRSLMQASGASMCLSHLAMAYYMAAAERGWWGPSWLALASLGLFIVGFSTGMGPIPWVVVGEVFPGEVVGSASAVATAVMWTCSFVVCLGFPALQAALGRSGVFLLFGGFCFGCLGFVTVMVPETKGRTVDEVLELLRARAGSSPVLSATMALAKEVA